MRVTKEQLFALYWSQEVLVYKSTEFECPVSAFNMEHHLNFYLKLRKLESITDEELRKVTGYTKCSEESIPYLRDTILLPGLNLPMYQVFRLIALGFAMNFEDLSIEDQVKEGWVKLID